MISRDTELGDKLDNICVLFALKSDVLFLKKKLIKWTQHFADSEII